MEDIPVYLNRFINSFEQRLEPPVRSHLKKVYGTLSMTCASVSAGVFLDSHTWIQGGLLSGFAGVGLMLMLMFTPDNGKNRTQRLGYLLGIGLMMGLGMGPLLGYANNVDPTLVLTALLGTTLVFVCFSVSAMLAKRGSWLFLGGPLMMILSSSAIFGMLNLFIQSSLIYKAELYIGLAAMCALVLFDTQLIIEKRRRGSTDHIGHALELFLDLYGIFKRLLIILTERAEENKRRRRD